jgi:hypothetical protein
VAGCRGGWFAGRIRGLRRSLPTVAARQPEEASQPLSPQVAATKNPLTVVDDSGETAGIRASTPVDFFQRLAEAAAITNAARRRLRRAEIVAEWIEQDFRGAFRFLDSEGFETLSLPGIGPMVAARATSDDLVTIANNATLTTDALLAIGRHLTPNQTAALAGVTTRVEGARVRDAAGVISGLLAAQNLDAATRYASDLAGTPAEAAAFAGIMDQLASSNSPVEAQALWDSLPEAVRSDDLVLFAHGNALRDTDPLAALSSLAAIQDLQTRKLALFAFAKEIEARSPEAAIQALVTSGLGAAGVDTHAARIFKTWSVHDAPAARAFVASADWLSNDQRGRWLAVIDQSARLGAPP